MATFVLNDIHDIERDSINHPNRVLPSGGMHVSFAVIMYFALLTASIVTINEFIPFDIFIYYILFLIAAINYNYIVEHFPVLKSSYVSACSTIPVMVTQQVIQYERPAYIVPISLFLFIFARETLMDILDFKGDGNTLAKIVGAPRATKLAFGGQMLSIIILFTAATTRLHMVAMVIALILEGIGLLAWRKVKYRAAAIELMRAQLAVCILLLIP